MLTIVKGGPWGGGGGSMQIFECFADPREFEWYVIESVYFWKRLLNQYLEPRSANPTSTLDVQIDVQANFPHIPPSGYFSRTRLKCSFTVVKPPLYCTRKWSCNLSCTSALSLLQLPYNGSTGQVPLPEAGSMLTCSSNCSFISLYQTMGFLQPWSCIWVVFWKNNH